MTLPVATPPSSPVALERWTPRRCAVTALAAGGRGSSRSRGRRSEPRRPRSPGPSAESGERLRPCARCPRSLDPLEISRAARGPAAASASARGRSARRSSGAGGRGLDDRRRDEVRSRRPTRGRRTAPRCRPARPVTNRNCSPVGAVCSTMTSASGASRWRSTARLSGRAPSSGVKPCVDEERRARTRRTRSPRAAPRRPRRSSTSRSSFSSSARICSRSKGRKTTTRSMRLRNSGRNDCATHPLDPLGAEGIRARGRSRPACPSRSPSRRSR